MDGYMMVTCLVTCGYMLETYSYEYIE